VIVYNTSSDLLAVLGAESGFIVEEGRRRKGRAMPQN